ncbi:hypothetical protein H181DRAFT_01599 [Streptomyces sp. WMMB 714]|uniref:PspA-associated protein PspAB n=1 Tax=Streptomyces sp. WMMB 714 TaxID=1286822 RepID=UPI0005F789B1|nr:hypothetical protein [Streptomyces sp. WMMB 714]SCK21909.1 hypothetical protein H181DRAFT_01599 [Streptomyces sp. WMMB 714]
MRLLDALLGRSRPARPDLDQLFGLPAAAVTLQAGADLVPTGLGSVCFASVEGGAFKQVERDVRALLDAGPPPGYLGDAPSGNPGDAPAGTPGDTPPAVPGDAPVEFSQDEYGYTWLLTRHGPQGTIPLVNDLHAVNTLLAEGGFGPQLLCSLVGFRGAGDGDPRALALVYLYKRGTFYPFAPRSGQPEKRDSALELQVRGLLTDDLRMEPDLARWFPLWGVPGL